MYLAEPTLATVFSHLLYSFWVQENQDLLIKCISQDLGFSGGKPVSACLIYKCLLQWRSFEVERTNIFDRIIQTVGSALEVWLSFCFSWNGTCMGHLALNLFPWMNLFYSSGFFLLEQRRNSYINLCLMSLCHSLKIQDNNDVLAYWLSNSSTLLLLPPCTLKATWAANLTPQRRRSASTSLFGRMSQVR